MSYIGHSQGTIMMFGLLASKLQYNDVIKPFVALSPVSFLGHSTTPLLFMTHFEPLYRSGQSVCVRLETELSNGFLSDHIRHRYCIWEKSKSSTLSCVTINICNASVREYSITYSASVNSTANS